MGTDHTLFTGSSLVFGLLAALIAVSPVDCLADETVQTELVEHEEKEGFLAVDSFLKAHGEFVSKAKRFTPLVELSTYYIPDAELESSEAEFDLFSYNLDALIPLPVGRDTFLLAGGHAGVRDYKVNTQSGFDDDRLYNMGFRFGGGHFVNDDLAIQGYWQPSIYSDFGGSPYSDDWKLWYGAGLAVYRTKENVFWKGGLVLTDALNTGVIPLFGVSWVFRPNWRLDILAPRLFEVSYQPNEEWDFQTGVRVDVEKYAIRQSRSGGELRRNVKVQDIRWYLGSIKKFSYGFSAFWRYGIAVRGKYDWGDEFVGRMEPSFFIRGGIGWNF